MPKAIFSSRMLALALLPLCGGCLQRTLTIRSDPPGAWCISTTRKSAARRSHARLPGTALMKWKFARKDISPSRPRPGLGPMVAMGAV